MAREAHNTAREVLVGPREAPGRAKARVRAKARARVMVRARYINDNVLLTASPMFTLILVPNHV